MSKGSKALIIFFAICIIFTIYGIIAENANKDKRKEDNETKNEAVNANYELIKEKIINPETKNVEKLEVKKSDTPDNLKDLSYVVIRSYVDGNNGSKWELSKSISSISDDLKPVYEKWSEEDLEKIPMIVFAISHVRGRTYKYVTGGSGNVEITTEGVNLYFYNTKTKTVFMTDEMKAKELPKNTNSSHSYTKSIYDVDATIKKDLGRFVMPSWVTGVIVLFVMFVVIPALIAFIKGMKDKKKNSN